MKFQEFKVLTDENISPKIVKYLRKMGIDVLDTKEQNWHGKEDEELLEIAFKEQRLVVTHDSDFGTLAINEGKRNYGIVYLRLRNVHPKNVTRIYDQLLQLDTSLPTGMILVVVKIEGLGETLHLPVSCNIVAIYLNVILKTSFKSKSPCKYLNR